MTVIVLKEEFAICKLPDFSATDFDGKAIYFCAKTADEYSLVCTADDIPYNAIKADRGWRAFRIAGCLDFSLVGILAKIAALFADNGISVFAVSTFDTDYVLTKHEHFERALQILNDNGYIIAR